MLRAEQQLDHPVKLRAVDVLDGGVDAVHVALHDTAEHVAAAHLVVRDLDALDGRQLAADQLLQRLLHAGVPVIAEVDGEAHDRRLTDVRDDAEPAGCHEGGLVIVCEDIARDALLPLGKRGHALFNRVQHVTAHSADSFSMCGFRPRSDSATCRA